MRVSFGRPSRSVKGPEAVGETAFRACGPRLASSPVEAPEDRVTATAPLRRRDDGEGPVRPTALSVGPDAAMARRAVAPTHCPGASPPDRRVENPTPDGPRFLTVGVEEDDFQLVLWPGTLGQAEPAMGRPGVDHDRDRRYPGDVRGVEVARRRVRLRCARVPRGLRHAVRKPRRQPSTDTRGPLAPSRDGLAPRSRLELLRLSTSVALAQPNLLRLRNAYLAVCGAHPLCAASVHLAHDPTSERCQPGRVVWRHSASSPRAISTPTGRSLPRWAGPPPPRLLTPPRRPRSDQRGRAARGCGAAEIVRKRLLSGLLGCRSRGCFSRNPLVSAEWARRWGAWAPAQHQREAERSRIWRISGLSPPPVSRPAFVYARAFVCRLPNWPADAAASRTGQRRCV